MTSLPASAHSATATLAPIAAGERIHALDIIRGAALIGIFLMNIEWFTRPITLLGSGVDTAQNGIDYFASWFVYTFVQGKFWTMFSLLFGMGFAVMLGRAEDNQRAFVTPYIRRIIGLFAFGSAHFVLLWPGDILHNYAFTAVFLLLIVTQSWRAWLMMLLWVAVAGYGFHADSLATMLVFVAAALVAGYVVLRTSMDRWYHLLALVVAAAAAAVSVGPTSEAMMVGSIALAVAALLMFFLGRGPVSRFYKFGAGLYLLPSVLSLLFLLATTVMPSLKPAPGPEQQKQRIERIAERKQEAVKEAALYSTGTYADMVRFRASEYAKELPMAVGGSLMALPLFLIGFWFVRSGVIGNIAQHLPLFRRLALVLLPLGLGLTLASAALHSSFPPGSGRLDSVVLARTLFELGALPQCIGYVAALVCLLSTRTGQLLLAPLRHAGRMALTNYLGASLIASLYFYNYGLGQYGQMPRATQVLFVLVVFSLQVAFSAAWLSKFQYGPMEWLWRAITYWQLPPMLRRQSPAVVAITQA